MKTKVIAGLLVINAFLGVKVYDTYQQVVAEEEISKISKVENPEISKVAKVEKIVTFENDKRWSRKYDRTGDRSIRFDHAKDIPIFKNHWNTWTGKKLIDKTKLEELVEIVLKRMPHIKNCENVKNLIVETAIAESGGGYDTDSSGGDYGIFQIRISTANSLDSWLKAKHQDVLKVLNSFKNPKLGIAENLAQNIPYGIALCITEYWRKAGPKYLNHIDTLKDRAIMWKSVYNTRQGAGTVNAYIARNQQYEKTFARWEKNKKKAG